MTTTPALLLLEDLLQRPELLVPPPAILHRLAWEGRLTLLAAPEKSGKSTLVGQAAAALVAGRPWLDTATEPARVLWLALDEPLADLVRRLAGYGATGGVVIATERLAPDQLEVVIRDHRIGLVVVDTLSEWASGEVEDFNSARDWIPVLARLRRILAETGAAGVLLHHTTRDGKRYRDSGQLGAGVDVILEMLVDEQDPTVRRVRARGRVEIADYVLRFTGGTYELEAGELPLEVRVYRVIDAEPGISMNRLRNRIGGKANLVDTAIEDLLAKQAIEDRGDSRARAYHVKVVKRPGQPRDKVRDKARLSQQSEAGQGRDNPGTSQGTTPLVPPPKGGLVGQGSGELSEEAAERAAIEAEEWV